MENFIRIGHFVINLQNVAYVSYENGKVYVHFCAPKGEQSMFLTFDGEEIKEVWDYFAKSASIGFGDDSSAPTGKRVRVA